MKKLSIITINLNNLDGLRKTTDSLLYVDSNLFEWIIVDGASNDGSVPFVESIIDRVFRFVSEPDKGIYHAMNKGAQLANGDYLMYLNSGDVLVQNVISEGFLNSLTADVEYGDCYVETRDGLQISRPDKRLTFQSFYARCICHQAVFVKRKLQLSYPFDENMKLASCRRFFIYAIVFGGASYNYFNIPVAIYDTGGLSSKFKDKLLSEQENYIKQYLPPLVLLDMERLKQFDRIAGNTPLYNVLEKIHGYSLRRKLFEKIVLFLSKLFFKL